VKIRVKRSRTSERKRAARASQWLATGALAAYASLGARAADPALAQSAEGAAQAQPAGQGQRPVLKFAIAGGSLRDVLEAFRAASGWQVAAAENAVLALPSPGVNGVFTSEQALKKLLAGTGVTYRLTGDAAATLDLRREESVLVTARGSALSSAKYTEPLRDVPQSITVIPKAVIQEQAATSLREVLNNVPGITMVAGEGGAPAGDNLTLRGFSARNDVFVDGVRDLGPQTRDPFNLEQVEVAKGPGSVFSGRGSSGGTINLVSKQPGPAAAYGASLAVGSDQTRRVTADVNRSLGGQASFRVNAMYHDADVAGRDVVTNERWGVAPTLGFGVGTGTRLTLSYFHLQQDNLSDYGVPWVPATNNALAAFRDQPAPVPRETFYGFLERDHENLKSDLGTVRFDRELSAGTALRSQVRFGRSTRDSIATPPRFAGNDSTAINRELRSWITEDEIWDAQTDLTAHAQGLGMDHSLVAGLALTREGNIRRLRTGPNSPTTLLDPDPTDLYPGTLTLGPAVGDVTADSVAVYLFDTAKLGSKLELTGGLRWDSFDVEGVSTVPAPIERVDRMLSLRAGAVFKPQPNGSVYAAYGSSLNPSLEGLSYGTANTAIEPEKTYTVEVGSKWDFARQRLSLNTALFRVEKTNARTPGLLPDDPPQVLQGRQRVDGFELGLAGTVTTRWRVFAGYTFLDGEVVESNTPAEVGHVLANTPRHSLSLWSTYETPWKLGLGAGARYTSERFANTTTNRNVDGYWVLDAMASLPVGRRLDLQLNVNNITDEYFFDRLGGGHLVPGPARRALLTANVKF
jgi:catecholate siderophore receptor